DQMSSAMPTAEPGSAGDSARAKTAASHAAAAYAINGTVAASTRDGRPALLVAPLPFTDVIERVELLGAHAELSFGRQRAVAFAVVRGRLRRRRGSGLRLRFQDVGAGVVRRASDAWIAVKLPVQIDAAVGRDDFARRRSERRGALRGV